MQMKASRLHSKKTSSPITVQYVLLLAVIVLWWVRWTTDVHLLNYSSSKTLETTNEQ